MRPIQWSRWTQHKNCLFLNVDTVLLDSNPDHFANIWQKMKLNKSDEVWNSANSLFKWYFRFVVIQKNCYYGNLTLGLLLSIGVILKTICFITLVTCRFPTCILGRIKWNSKSPSLKSRMNPRESQNAPIWERGIQIFHVFTDPRLWLRTFSIPVNPCHQLIKSSTKIQCS